MQDRVVIFGSRVGFSGTAYLMASFTITSKWSLMPLPWQRNLGQIGYNSAYNIRDITEIFAYSRGFSGRAIEWRQTNSTTTNPRCHGNEIWDKNGYNSACLRDISEIFSSTRGFIGERASNDSGVIENMDFHGFRRYVFGSFGNQAKAIIQ